MRTGVSRFEGQSRSSLPARATDRAADFRCRRLNRAAVLPRPVSPDDLERFLRHSIPGLGERVRISGARVAFDVAHLPLEATWSAARRLVADTGCWPVLGAQRWFEEEADTTEDDEPAVYRAPWEEEATAAIDAAFGVGVDAEPEDVSVDNLPALTNGVLNVNQSREVSRHLAFAPTAKGWEVPRFLCAPPRTPVLNLSGTPRRSENSISDGGPSLWSAMQTSSRFVCCSRRGRCLRFARP